MIPTCLLGIDLWSTKEDLPTPCLVSSVYGYYKGLYLEADFGEIVDFANVVEGEFSEVGIGIFPVEVLEMPVGVIISPEEEVIITFAEPNPKPTVNNSKILPIENLAHINRPLILSPAKLVPS